jgi:hypothetical protein
MFVAKMHRFPAVAAALCACLSQVWVENAHACSRILLDPAERSDQILPRDLTYDVPINTRIWVGGKFTTLNEGARLDLPRLITLREAESGTEVEGSQSLLDTDDIETTGMVFSVFSPGADLAPDTEYQVVVQGEILSRFITGSQGDTTAPEIPTVRVTGTTEHAPDRTGFDCSFPATATYEWESAEDDTIRLVAQITDRSAPNLVEESIEGALEVVTTEGVFTVAEFSDAETITLQVSAFDLSGNFSGWGETFDTQLSFGPGGCACLTNAAPGPWGGLPFSLALMGLVFAGLKRRGKKVPR